MAGPVRAYLQDEIITIEDPSVIMIDSDSDFDSDSETTIDTDDISIDSEETYTPGGLFEDTEEASGQDAENTIEVD